MSIEKLLSDLTTALNNNTKALNDQFEDTPEPDAGAGAAATQKQLSGKAPPPPDPVAADNEVAAETTQAPTPTVDDAAAATQKQLTGAEINTLLKKEFVRIGNVREPIDKVMKALFDVDSLHNLKPEDYRELVTAIAQIPSA